MSRAIDNSCQGRLPRSLAASYSPVAHICQYLLSYLLSELLVVPFWANQNGSINLVLLTFLPGAII
jgi:hypothetical protein